MRIARVAEDLARLVQGDTTAAQLSIAQSGERVLERSSGAYAPDPDAPAVTERSPFIRHRNNLIN